MKKRVLVLFYLPVLFFFWNSGLNAQKKVSYGGYFQLGGEAEYKDIYIESFYKAKLEFELKLNEKIKVEIDIRGDSETRQFELYEASAAFKLSNEFKLEIGDLKKRYGLEELVSHEKLATINKSMINNYLEPLGYVNREPGVQIHWFDDNSKTGIISGIHYNESHKLTFMARFTKEGFLGFDAAGFNLQFAKEARLDMPNTYAVSFDLQKNIGTINCNFEIFNGEDPVESYYRALTGDNDKVKYLGLKALVLNNFELNGDILKSIEPFFLTSFLVTDIKEFDVNSIQFLIGCNFYFDEDVRLMIDGDLYLTNHSYDKTERTLYGSNVIAQLQIRW